MMFPNGKTADIDLKRRDSSGLSTKSVFSILGLAVDDLSNRESFAQSFVFEVVVLWDTVDEEWKFFCDDIPSGVRMHQAGEMATLVIDVPADVNLLHIDHHAEPCIDLYTLDGKTF